MEGISTHGYLIADCWILDLAIHFTVVPMLCMCLCMRVWLRLFLCSSSCFGKPFLSDLVFVFVFDLYLYLYLGWCQVLYATFVRIMIKAPYEACDLRYNLFSEIDFFEQTIFHFDMDLQPNQQFNKIIQITSYTYSVCTDRTWKIICSIQTLYWTPTIPSGRKSNTFRIENNYELNARNTWATKRRNDRRKLCYIY